MDAKQIIQARIDELQQDMDSVVEELKQFQSHGGTEPFSKDQAFQLISSRKDQVLGLRSAIAELKNIKELV